MTERKHWRTGIYWGDEGRSDRVKRLMADLGIVSESELVRRLVDLAAEARGVFDDPRDSQLRLPLAAGVAKGLARPRG